MTLEAVPGVASLAVGGLIGWAMGYFIKKFLKLILFALGGIFTLMAFMQYQGWSIIQWHKVTTDTQSFANTTSHQILQSVNNTASHLALNGMGSDMNIIYMMIGAFGFMPAFWLGFIKG